MNMCVAYPGFRIDIIHLPWDIIPLLFQAFRCDLMRFPTPVWMLFKDTDTPFNVIWQFQLICIDAVADHGVNFTKDPFKSVCSQENNLKATIWVILLILFNTEINILNHGHHVKEELDRDKVALVVKIQGQCDLSQGTEANQLFM